MERGARWCGQWATAAGSFTARATCRQLVTWGVVRCPVPRCPRRVREVCCSCLTGMRPGTFPNIHLVLIL